MKLFRDLHLFPRRRRTRFVLTVYLILISASIISSGVFLLLKNISISVILLIVISEITGLALSAIPVFILARRYSRPHEEVKRGIKLIGQGSFEKQIDSKNKNIDADLTESVNDAGQMLNQKMQSIISNTNRLSAVEKELSSCFKTEPVFSSHAKALVCQLKINVSRLRNDLNEFSVKNPQPEESTGRQEKSDQSSISV